MSVHHRSRPEGTTRSDLRRRGGGPQMAGWARGMHGQDWGHRVLHGRRVRAVTHAGPWIRSGERELWRAVTEGCRDLSGAGMPNCRELWSQGSLEPRGRAEVRADAGCGWYRARRERVSRSGALVSQQSWHVVVQGAASDTHWV